MLEGTAGGGGAGQPVRLGCTPCAVAGWGTTEDTDGSGGCGDCLERAGEVARSGDGGRGVWNARSPRAVSSEGGLALSDVPPHEVALLG